MKINNGYIKSNFNFIICLTISIIITSTCMILININSNLTTVKTSNNLSTYALICNNINSINTSMNNCIADTSINIDATPSLLNNALNNLDNCKNSLSQTASTNSSNLDSDLLKSINSTIDLYTYCLNYISTYDETSVDQLVSDLDMLKNNCFESYSKITDYGLYLNSNNNINDFLSAFVNHYSRLNQIKIQNQIKDTQATEFKTTLSLICNNFSNLLEDLQPAIERIQAENRSYNVLLEDLNSKEDSFNALKKELNNISIPEGYLSYYNSVQNIFTLYSSYLNSIRTAIIYERSSTNTKKNNETISKNFDNAYAKYSEVKETLTKFIVELENS